MAWRMRGCISHPPRGAGGPTAPERRIGLGGRTKQANTSPLRATGVAEQKCGNKPSERLRVKAVSLRLLQNC
eukprot:3768684-Amphidinium_carterae.1